MFLVLAQEGGAQAGSQPQPQGGGLGGMVFMLVAMGLVWWFLVLGPQKKADKLRRAKLDAIAKGDKVRTRGGIEGVVARVQDDTVIVRIDTEGKVHVPFSKVYIEDVLTDAPAPESKETK
jgi:preprotein translocase subunit YajC